LSLFTRGSPAILLDSSFFGRRGVLCIYLGELPDGLEMQAIALPLLDEWACESRNCLKEASR